MKLEQQVCSLELAQKLKEFGVKQESLFTWRLSIDQSGNEPAEWFVSHWSGKEDELHYAAFTVAELGEMLPWFLNVGAHRYELDLFKNGESEPWSVGLVVRDEQIARILGGDYHRANTEADARAKMLIYLLENKLLTI